jgi:dolichol-phosphate mannosyltransferase
MPPELMIVMPVYNEQASVRKVVMEWFQEIENWTESFVFLAIDDGSTDQSLDVLKRLQSQLGSRMEVLSRENRGHGQSCLQGYRQALSQGIPWIMQIDSDGQCDPQYFFRLWRLRKEKDIIYGRRASRDDGWRRVVASHILRFTLLVTCGVYCTDANVPYRLIRTETLKDHINRIPPDFFLANVALSVLLRRDYRVRESKIRIHFRERYGGEPSVALGKFGNKATELIRQLWALKNS